MLLQLTILRPWECATTALVRFPNQLLTSNNKTNSDRLTNILAMTMTQSLSHLSSRMLVMITTKKHTSTIMGSTCSLFSRMVRIATKKEHLATITITGPTQQRVREKKSTGWMCWIVLDFPALFFDIDKDNIFPALVAHSDLH